MNPTSQLMQSAQQGDPTASEDLLALLYEELRNLAAAKIAREGPGISLQGTALVHEAYLRLVGNGAVRSWDSRGHFFAAAAEAMRRILVERARQKKCIKRGAGLKRNPLLDFPDSATNDEELLALDEALNELQGHDRQAYCIVMLRYFGGLSHQESAASMGISRRVADRLWAVARVRLYEKLRTSL